MQSDPAVVTASAILHGRCFVRRSARGEPLCGTLSSISVLDQIDKDWIKKADQLNMARNMAAHTCDSNKVLEAFGCNGSQAVEHLRDRRIKLLEDLIGIKREEEANEADAT